MSREYIEVTGARENNLRNVSVRVPKRAITAFVGVSGSGNGDAGGAVVFTGTPADLCAAPGSHTGAHLARHVTT